MVFPFAFKPSGKSQKYQVFTVELMEHTVPAGVMIKSGAGSSITNQGGKVTQG
jgi:hypothetical protein